MCGFFLKELKMKGSGTEWTQCRVNYESSQGFHSSHVIPTRYCAGCFSKIPTMGLVGKVGANGWILFKSIHHGPGG